MSTHKLRVSVGMPVFNGENYLEDAIKSILAQRYSDFEFIISDNASTDRTEEICRTYAAQDKRIRYYRNSKNLGAAKNFNRVFGLSGGEYFKWAAHDDLIAPDFLVKCVDALDKDSSIVLCYSKAKIIDEYGVPLETYERGICTDSPKPRERFLSNILCRGWFQIFGLIRADALRITPLVGNHAGGDSILLARLNFMGPFYEIPECLLSLRKHPQQSMNLFGVYAPGLLPDEHAYTVWFDPEKATKVIFPHWAILGGYLSALRQASMTWYDRAHCYLYIVGWVVRLGHYLAYDVLLSIKEVLARPMRALRKEKQLRAQRRLS